MNNKKKTSFFIANNSRGITLVALVVTIVVLLILAGITVTMLFGENGIIKKAQEAKDATEISQIKDEADLVKLGLISNSGGTTITKESLITALNEHFTGSTLENGRVIVKDGKYDIIVGDDLEIVVVKHGEGDISDGSTNNEIEITYETVVGYYNKTIKVHLEFGKTYEEFGKTYEEFADEFLADKTRDELEELLVKSFHYIGTVDQFLTDMGMSRDQIEQMAQSNGMTYDDFLKFMLKDGGAIENFGGETWINTEYYVYLAGGQGKDQTELEQLLMSYYNPESTFDDVITNELGTTRENFLSFAQSNGFRAEKDFVKFLLAYMMQDETITVTCSNGKTVITNTEELYAEFTVTENGTYTITATKASGQTGEVQVVIDDIVTTGENQEVEDSYGNKIMVPGGFSIVPNGTDGVEYTYIGDGSGTPSVQDGIVIEDNYGNQFVWIPVGTINNKADDPNGETTTITLARYTFNTDGIKSSPITKGDTGIGDCKELASSSYGNTVAKDIEEFKTCATTKGGYYIARYEASNNNGLAASKSNVAVWNNITQPNAATIARRMYGENSYFVSDLINSYAWDTAIVFIQTYSGDSDYSKQTSLNTSLANTGASGDKVCNIYDMASNCLEWTTETYTFSSVPCVLRGGGCHSSRFTSNRSLYSTSVSGSNVSFRVALYVK